MRPTVGRIVHYHITRAGADKEFLQPCAAMITEVHGDTCVNLRIYGADGSTVWGQTSVVLSEEPKEGCCSWPPRVE